MTAAVQPSSRRTESHHRALGAGVAAGISLCAAIVLGVAGDTDALRGIVDREVLLFVALGSAIGVPVGAVLGWAHAPAAIASRGGARLGLVARLATLAVFFGDAMLAVVMAAVGMVELVPDAVSMANAAGSAFIVFFVFGLLIFGVPAWVLAAAVCALWVTVIAGGAGGDGSSDGRHGA